MELNLNAGSIAAVALGVGLAASAGFRVFVPIVLTLPWLAATQ